MEPWAYRCSMMLLKEASDDGNVHTMLISHGNFWVQLYRVPMFCITVAVAKAIGVVLGEVKWVENRAGEDCVGYFIRIHVCFDVDLLLIRKVLVTFP